MTVQQIIDALKTIEDKSQECYFDVTPAISAHFVLRSIDIIEQISNEDNENMILLSCGLKESNQIFLN